MAVNRTALIPLGIDIRTSVVLGLSFGLVAAMAMPFLVEVIPDSAGELPLPLPWFSLAIIPIFGLQYSAYALGGCRACRKAGVEPAPLLTRLWAREPRSKLPWREHGKAIAWGLAAGLAITAITYGVRLLEPALLPATLHPNSIPAALGASAAASIGEEILTRLLLLGLLAWWLGPSKKGRALAITLAALVFGALHAPTIVFLFGGIEQIHWATWVWLLALNGIVGGAAGWSFFRCGIGGAMLVHFSADLVWHVGSVAVG